MDNPEVAKLIQNLTSNDFIVRSEATKALRKIGGVAVPVLIQALKNGDFHVRNEAANALVRVGDAAIPALIEALKDEKRVVRLHAAAALGKRGAASAVPALIEVLKDEDSDVRYHAASALGHMEDVLAVSALIGSLKEKNKWVRREAAGALQMIGDAASLPREILAASQLSVPERIKVLADLRHVRYRDNYTNTNLLYNFPETRELCQTVLQEDDAAAWAGAQAVLNWLNGDRDLLRASQRDTATEPQELLRATQEEMAPVQPETLLREASAPQANADKSAPRRTLRERLFGK